MSRICKIEWKDTSKNPTEQCSVHPTLTLPIARVFSNNDGAKPWRTSPDSGLRSFPRVDSAWFLKQWHQRDAAAPAQRLPSLKLFRPI